MMIILLLILLAILGTFGYHMYVEPIDFISKLLGEKDKDKAGSKKGGVSSTSSTNKDCSNATPGLGKPCPGGCKALNVSCVDCREMKEKDCNSHAECTWHKDGEVVLADGTKLSGHCTGIVGHVKKYSDQEEHCSKYGREEDAAGCNADPYCFYVTKDEDIHHVKAGSAFDSRYPVDVDDATNYVSRQFFNEGEYSNARFSGVDWFKKSEEYKRLCLPLKCDRLDGEACMREATSAHQYESDGSYSSASEKRHCTVLNNSSPSPTCADAA